MLEIDAVATVTESGKLVVDVPAGIAPGPHRIRISLEETLATEPAAGALADLAEFRRNLGARAYPGSSVVDARRDERYGSGPGPEGPR